LTIQTLGDAKLDQLQCRKRPNAHQFPNFPLPSRMHTLYSSSAPRSPSGGFFSTQTGSLSAPPMQVRPQRTKALHSERTQAHRRIAASTRSNRRRRGVSPCRIGPIRHAAPPWRAVVPIPTTCSSVVSCVEASCAIEGELQFLSEEMNTSVLLVKTTDIDFHRKFSRIWRASSLLHH
jgi:hypothetical protein